MNNNRLGKGLSSLLGEKKINLTSEIFNIDASSEKIHQIDVNFLQPNKFQPRKYFNEEEIKELSLSIKEFGILQPLVARKIEENKYEIIAGERRYRASKLIGLKTVPVIVKNFNDKDVLSLAIIENIQRSDLSAIEEAEAYNSLIKNFNCTQQEVADFVGKSRSYIANSIRLLCLPEEIKQLLYEKKIDIGHARTLIGIDDSVELAKMIVEKNLTVRDVENIVRKFKNKLNSKKNDVVNSKFDKDFFKKIESNLFDKINLKSKIEFNSKNNKGKITIKYNSIEELEKFLKKIN